MVSPLSDYQAENRLLTDPVRPRLSYKQYCFEKKLKKISIKHYYIWYTIYYYVLNSDFKIYNTSKTISNADISSLNVQKNQITVTLGIWVINR